jgi:uncharacterized repeat protein (TIGR03803 family)
MTSRSLPACGAALLFAVLGIVAPANASEEVLFSFNITDGAGPVAGLVADSEGNLYGTAAYGGINGSGGTAFELSPSRDGRWTEHTLHNFSNQQVGGGSPEAPLVFDRAGNLYGTTYFGGPSNRAGSVFELRRSAQGWRFRNIIVGFNASGARYPDAGLVVDREGNLYGTTAAGGEHGRGTVFEIVRGGNGRWTDVALHSFPSDAMDGVSPEAGLLLDASGNLYGTTYNGGGPSECTFGCGVAFVLTRSARSEQVLYRFHREAQRDGARPLANLTFGVDGSLYGTTYNGGAYGGKGGGTIYRLTRTAGRGWRERVLHSFAPFGGARDGSGPAGGLVRDGAGNLYGTTYYGGDESCDCGLVFELVRGANDTWTYVVLHRFTNGSDGEFPIGNLLLDRAGNLYGVTYRGGAYSQGTVYRIKP